MKIFIGVGHGGADGGACANNLQEKDINLDIALAMANTLTNFGVEVLLSRTTDEDDPLTDEIKECNAFNPDFAIDIHTNAGGGKGFEVFYQTNTYQSKSLELAKAVEDEVLKLGQNSRGCKTRLGTSGTDYYGFLRSINCPSIITECGFIDNLNDVALINTADKQKAFGVAYARAVLKILGISTTIVDTTSLTAIAGDSKTSYEQLTNYLNSINPNAIKTFGDLPKMYLEEGQIEGIRGDVAFAQACLETGHFTFGGDVLPEQNNFCGLGATGGGERGCSFESPYWGIMAHVQHLKAYADKEECYQKIIDPRFQYVERGVSPYVEWLGQKENPTGKGWATDLGYGDKILGVLQKASTSQNISSLENNVKIVQEKTNLEDQTISWLLSYQYAEPLFEKLVGAM